MKSVRKRYLVPLLEASRYLVPLSKFRLGRQGESLAANFLKASGYRILKRNVKCKLGEIDLIARDGKTLCFVEVKSASMDGRVLHPEEAVGREKQRRLVRLASWYLKVTRQESVPVRFDVVSILTAGDGSAAKTRLIKGAFDAAE